EGEGRAPLVIPGDGGDEKRHHHRGHRVRRSARQATNDRKREGDEPDERADRWQIREALGEALGNRDDLKNRRERDEEPRDAPSGEPATRQDREDRPTRKRDHKKDREKRRRRIGDRRRRWNRIEGVVDALRD